MSGSSAALKENEKSKVVPLNQVPMGLTCKGLIMEKIAGTTSKGDPTFHLAIVVKGLESQLKIKVTEDVFNAAEEMTPYASSVKFSEFNGRMYWQESDIQ